MKSLFIFGCISIIVSVIVVVAIILATKNNVPLVLALGCFFAGLFITKGVMSFWKKLL